MAITFPLALPNTTDIRLVTMMPRAVVGVSESPFTLQQQVNAFPADRWDAEIVLTKMNRASAEKWLAFFLKLNGPEGTMLLGDPAGLTARGTPTGSPQVDGASQTGKELDTKGWTNNSTGNLLEGDYIQIGTGSGAQLYKVLDASVDADGSGLSANINIWPRLRTSPADSATVVTSSTVGVFRLVSTVMDWSVDEALIYETSFKVAEAT